MLLLIGMMLEMVPLVIYLRMHDHVLQKRGLKN